MNKGEIASTAESRESSSVDETILQRLASALMISAGYIRGDCPMKVESDEAIGRLTRLLHSLITIRDIMNPTDAARDWAEIVELALGRIATMVSDGHLKLVYDPGDERPDDMETGRTFRPEQWGFEKDESWRE